MTTSQKYYQILDYNQRTWDRILSFPKGRDLLKNNQFLSAPISCLVGEKGVGKTVLACQKALEIAHNDPSKIFYISLDDTLFAADSMYDLAVLAQDHGVRVIVFDEVHRYSEWKSDLKKIVDRLSIRCIVSGSSILSFKDLGGLARRMVKYHLQGMTFREYLNLAYDTNIAPLTLGEITAADNSQLKNIRDEIALKLEKPLPLLFDEYLKRGYYTFSLAAASDSDFHKMLRQATEDTISYEIVLAQTHSRPDMARKLQAIFKKVAQNVPYSVNYDDLKSYAQISDQRTLKHYIACLQDAGIIRTLERPSLKALRKAEKLYLGNTCLYHAYADLQPNLGSLRETFFLTSMALAGLEVFHHDGNADFLVGSYVFEVGGPKKGKRQIKEEIQAFVVRDSWDLSLDPQIIPLWSFGLY
jgi:predicted AAA+ superfamily ATPase